MTKLFFILVLLGVFGPSPRASKIVKEVDDVPEEGDPAAGSKLDGLPNPDNPVSFDEVKTSGKIFKLPSGGTAPEQLQKIREMAKVQKKHPQKEEFSNSRVGTKGGGFPFTSYGIPGQNHYFFGPFFRNRKPQRHATGGSRPTGGHGGTSPSHPGSTGPRPGYSGPTGGGSSHGGSSHGGSSGSSGYGYGYSLTSTDYKHIFIHMLQEIFKMLNANNLLYESSFVTKVLYYLFYLLQDIRILHSHQSGTLECPDIYYQSGDLCLSVDVIDSFLDYYEARLYCQTVKGSDLVMFRDANEYRSIVEFIQKIDPKNQHSYWVGISDAEDEGNHLFLDSRHVHKLSPYWGVRLEETGSPPTAREHAEEHPPREIAPFDIGDYVIMNKDDFYYLWDADSAFAEEKKTLPLCQYIPERDQKNFQYGEGVFEDWQDYNELAGWYQDERYEKHPPHSHYGYGPLGPGHFGYLGGHHTPWRRSSRKEGVGM